jgi:hypothetical protein
MAGDVISPGYFEGKFMYLSRFIPKITPIYVPYCMFSLQHHHQHEMNQVIQSTQFKAGWVHLPPRQVSPKHHLDV